MACRIENQTIYLTRGDTLKVQITIYKDEDVYNPIEGDTVRFALKHPAMKRDKSDFVDEEPLLVKPIPIDTLILTLDPEDTKSLGFGDYVYDIELTAETGEVDTFIANQKIVLTPEVH